MRAWVVLATVVACGRFAFDERGDAPVGDGAGGSDGGATGFCAGLSPAPTFCDDFDEGRPVGSGWSDFITQLGGTVTISSAEAKSLPAAFESKVAMAGGSGGVGFACLEYMLPTSHQFHYAYDLFVVSRPASGTVEIGSVNFTVSGVGTFYNDIALRATGSDSYHEELNPDGGSAFLSGDVLTPQLASNVWHHIDMRLDLDAKTYAFTVDAVPVSSGATRYPVAAAPIIVQCGINYMNQSQPTWDIYVDNVVVDAQ